MICLTCGHYSAPDGEMEREQRSGDCRCRCHPWNQIDNRTHPVGCGCGSCASAMIADAWDPRMGPK